MTPSSCFFIKTLLNGFDLRVEEFSKSNVPFHFVCCFSKCTSHKISSVVLLLRNFSFSQNRCSSWSKLTLLRMKKIFLRILSGAAKFVFPIKLGNFVAASSYHGDQLQRTHHLLTGCQWNFDSWSYHLLTSNFPWYHSHYYVLMWLVSFQLIWEVPHILFCFPTS